jgi:hypothetical protein
MPAFKPDIDKPETESPDEGEVAPTLTKSDWMRFISDSVQETVPTASPDQARAAAEATIKRAAAAK